MSNSRMVQIVGIVSITAVILALLAVAVAELRRGGPEGPSQAIGLFAFVGTLIGLLGTLINGLKVQAQLNGHLAQHDEAAKAVTAQAVTDAVKGATVAAIEAAAQQQNGNGGKSGE